MYLTLDREKAQVIAKGLNFLLPEQNNNNLCCYPAESVVFSSSC
jgi:hypothetical protein